MARKYSENVHKFRTPSKVFNALSAGGIKMGTISEFWGRFKCFTGDMRVQLSDGSSKSFKELSELGDTFQVFGYDIESGKMVESTARFAGSHLANQLAYVHLDSGFMIKCTVDHKFLTDEDVYVEAKDLKKDMSLSTTYDFCKIVKLTGEITIKHLPVKVIRVEIVDKEEPVYDINVDIFSNFSIDIGKGMGVVVHNSGKTTATYDMAVSALNDYGVDARVVIIDAEATSDASRLASYGLFPGNGEIETLEQDPRVFLHYIATIEEAIDTCMKYAEDAKKNSTPTLIIVDSISTLKPKNEVDELNKSLETGKEANKFSAGMMLASRVMTSKLTDLLNKLPMSNTAVVLINQATVDMDSTYIKRDKAKGGKFDATHCSNIVKKISLIAGSPLEP